MEAIMKNLLSILSGITLLMVSAGYGYTFQHQPAGATQLVDFDFSTNQTNSSICDPVYAGGGYIESDASAPISPPSILKHAWPYNSGGNTPVITCPFGGKQDVYVCYSFKYSNPFLGQQNLCNKIAAIWVGGSILWFEMFGQQQGGPYTHGQILSFYNTGGNQHLGNGFGDNGGTWKLFPNINNPVSTLGTWHVVEIYGKLSSTPFSKDGILRWWVDGVLHGDYNTVNYPAGGFEQVQFTPTWDHANHPAVDYQWFDHLRVTTGGSASAIPVSIVTGSLPSAQSGKPYTATLQANYGKAPYAWVISSGSLLPGLSLNKSTGIISGVPANGGRCDFTAKVLDANVPPQEATKSFYIIASGTTSTARDAGKLPVAGSQLSVKAGNRSVLFQVSGPMTNQIAIYDLSGRELWSHSGSGDAIWNHGGNLKKGMYLVRAKQNGTIINSVYCNIR